MRITSLVQKRMETLLLGYYYYYELSACPRESIMFKKGLLARVDKLRLQFVNRFNYLQPFNSVFQRLHGSLFDPKIAPVGFDIVDLILRITEVPPRANKKGRGSVQADRVYAIISLLNEKKNLVRYGRSNCLHDSIARLHLDSYREVLPKEYPKTVPDIKFDGSRRRIQ